VPTLASDVTFAQGICPAKTRADLELDRLLAALEQRAKSPVGRRYALSLPFLREREQVLASLAEIQELRALAVRGLSLPIGEVSELSDSLGRARIGQSLSLSEVFTALSTLRACVAASQFLRKQEAALAALSRRCPIDPSLDGLVAELGVCFTNQGELADEASPRLAEVRGEQRSAKAHIVERLTELMRSYAGSLSDSYWTERDGRFVLPVRADAENRFPGIVHAASSGGSTLFVEPRVIVSLGNRLKVLDAVVTREEELVLGRLSAQLAASSAGIEQAVASLAVLDVRQASAELAEALDLRPPRIVSPREGISLPKARHPLLALDGVKVVPSDLALKSGQVLVLSGPNAGGKTVALKALGLAALMVRLGLPVASGDDAAVGLYEQVLSDVGDQQSLSKNLSTFSAHIENLAEISSRTDSGALILLDEIASGTDPREGEALASAFLGALADAGGTVACTTHYEALKVLASTDARFHNASAGFDLQKLAPTFEIHDGIPGPSAALAVARRFGIPEAVCTRAEGLLERGSLDVSRLLAELLEEKAGLASQRATLEREQAAMAEAKAQMALEKKRWDERDERAVQRETEALVAAVKRAREDLRMAELRMKTATLEAKDFASVSAIVESVARSVAIGGPLEPPRREPAVESVAKAALFPGARVYVPKLRTEADVLEVLASGQVRVAAGPMKLLVSLEELRRVTKTESKAESKAKAARPTKPRSDSSRLSFDAAADPDVPIQTAENTVDLRGLRAHEAIEGAEQFMDSCTKRGLSVAFLIHGHGTGALRQALRESLQSSPYVQRSRPGDPREGGDGVTVVWLR
jgi:DNA mismatch repair protein MutS2